MSFSLGLRLLRRGCLGWLVAALLAVAARGQATLVQDGQAVSVIITPNSPTAIVTLAAQELQKHLQLMSGATVPIDTLSKVSSYPGKHFIYLSSATGITAPSTTEFYTIRVQNGNLYISGKDTSNVDYTDLSGCQPGNLFGVYHVLNEFLGVNWIWPGDLGIIAPKKSTIIVPAMADLTTGPNMVQRKFRNPKDSWYINNPGVYKGASTNYIPMVPTDASRRVAIGKEELLWQRRLRMGTRKSLAFGHSETQWWANYGTGSANPHPEYFAILYNGGVQPKPATDEVKLHVSGAATIAAKVQEWVNNGQPSTFNVCPNDSRNFCICPTCLAWDYPAQDPSIINSDSSALLGDRYARWYSELAKKIATDYPTKNVTLYGYAYDVYRHAPIQTNIPANVALAYIPGSTSASVKDLIAQTQTDVLGWIAHGCTQMYLRPNWMLAGHAGPFWPTYRLGNSFRDMLAGGYLLGLDSDSSAGSYCNFGLYYYTVARLMNHPDITIDQIMDEYCSGFGNASTRIRDYFSYWENFVYNQSDSGNTDILGWSSGMDAYAATYTDAAFDGAEKILNDAAALAAGDADATARIAFLRVGCINGRLTFEALRQTNSTKQTQAFRALLAYRNSTADGFALWREWLIDREGYNKTRAAVWATILANPVNYGSNAGAFTETTFAPGNQQVVMEAENATSTAASVAANATAGAIDGIPWQVNTTTAGASGTAMQTPNNGTAAIETTLAARLDYKVNFATTGTWYVWVRLAGGLDVNSDSVNTGLDGVVVSKNLANTTGSWAWVGSTAATPPVRATINVTTAGVHTFNVWSREDGVIIDRIILSTSSSYTPTAGDIGPAVSASLPTGEHLLTVGLGTGDGYYGTGSIISVSADTAPTNYVFDHWTGDTAGLASTTASSTTYTMPAADARIDATYKLSPSADTDGDGILDAWEMAQFGNLTTANATSDADGDGASDLSEFLAGTDPKDPASSLRITSVTRATNGDVTLTWTAVAGKTYRLMTSTTLQSGSWTSLSVDITATAPLNTYTVRTDSARQFFRVEVE